MSRLIAAIALVLTVSAEGQTRRKPSRQQPRPAGQSAPAASASSWPIASLRVEGNNNYTDEQVIAMSGLRIGQVAGKNEFEAARDKLLSTGAFESVGYKFGPAAGGNQYVATFEVLEVGQIFPYRFESLGADEQELRTWLRKSEPSLGEKIPATQQVLERVARSIEQFLARSGNQQKVVGRLSPEAGNELAVVFQPASLPAVAEVNFEGNTVIKSRTLQQAVSGAAIGSIFTEPRFRQILDLSVRPLYEEQGYLRVAFPKISTAPVKDVNGIGVTVQIEEGAIFQLREVALTGALAGRRDLLKQGGFKLDEVANMTAVRKGVDDMVRSVQRSGHMKAKAETTRKLDDSAKTVDLAVQIDPGPQFAMGKLTIQGLDIQTEPHIRKLWALKGGKPFDIEYPDFFLKRIHEDQLFDNLGKTSASTKVDEQERTVDVTLVFKAEPKRPPRVVPEVERSQRPEPF